MLKSSFRIGSVAGIQIGVHYTWFVVFLLLSSSLFAVFRGGHPEWSSISVLMTALVSTLLFFVSVILHELGHSLVAIARGVHVRAITLFIFGGIAQTEKESDSAATEFYIAIAGPLVSLALAGLFYILGFWSNNYSETISVAFDWLATINFVLAVFNLVPGFPLDGGRVFRALVWKITGNAVKGIQWAVVGGKVVAYGLMLMGIMTALLTGLLLNGLWLVGIGWFLLVAAEGSKRAYFTERLAGHIPVGDVMQKEVPKIPAEMSILNWIDEQILLTGQRSSLITEDSQTIGLITLNDVVKYPRTQWSDTRVRMVMTPAEQLYTVNPTNSVLDVLKIMREQSINQVPVMNEGIFVGWIDREHLLKILELHTEIGR